jgi:hypothetical protein
VTSVAVLEHLTLVTPFGVRLRDAATSSDVFDALSVVVYPAAEPERRSSGAPSASGIFVFSNLPGLRAVETGRSDLAPNFPFVLEVRDQRGRYLPFRIAVTLPQHGVQTFPLFSSATRALPDGMGAMRLELFDTAGRAAAWAVVEATAGEQPMMTGLSDEKGRVLVPLRYPKPVISLGSPGTLKTPLTKQSWSVGVTIRYRRRDPIPSIPDLADILSQPEATALLPTSPLTPWTQGTLRFGQELVPETAGGEAMPVLLIQPADSPP